MRSSAASTPSLEAFRQRVKEQNAARIIHTSRKLRRRRRARWPGPVWRHGRRGDLPTSCWLNIGAWVARRAAAGRQPAAGRGDGLNRQAVAEGQLWRLWTGQFCHWSVLHLAGNLAAAVAICVIAGRPIRSWFTALPLVAPLLSLFLLVAVPGLERYRGLSGLVAMLVVGAAIEGGLVGRILAVAYLAKLGSMPSPAVNPRSCRKASPSPGRPIWVDCCWASPPPAGFI